MSFWGATVITKIFSLIPVIGSWVVSLLWGGPNVSVITLRKFLVLHFLLPLLTIVFMIAHILILHTKGSSLNPNNNTLFSNKIFSVKLYPIFYIKDILYLFMIIAIILFIAFFYPRVFDNPVNNIEANPYLTPRHIIPEWYFLYLYSTLKLFQNKTGGVLMMLTIFFLPILKNFFNNISNNLFCIIFKIYKKIF